jgi:hypothetical protein
MTTTGASDRSGRVGHVAGEPTGRLDGRDRRFSLGPKPLVVTGRVRFHPVWRSGGIPVQPVPGVPTSPPTAGE